MPEPRRIQLDELVNRPGTYFNPLTEILMVVDDSPHLDTEAIELESFNAEDWAVVSDEIPLDEHERDQLLERFQVRYQSLDTGQEDDEEVEEETLEPDADPEDEA
jgi:hypothetical protein